MNYSCAQYPYNYADLYVAEDKRSAIYAEVNGDHEKLVVLFLVEEENVLIPIKCDYFYDEEVVIDSYDHYMCEYGPFAIECEEYPARKLIYDYFGDDVIII